MHVSAAFESGNIEVVEARDGAIDLKIRPDGNAEYFQWFCFRLAGGAGAACDLRIVNAGEASYTRGWDGYRAVASTDGEDWRRVPTTYADGVLTIRHEGQSDQVKYAYFAPYERTRHHALIAHCLASGRARLCVPGTSVEGADPDLLTFGAPGEGKRVAWAIGRQHPGETMASWWMEGFLRRLSDAADPVARAVLEHAVVHVVPNMNPDGSFRGNLRANAAGANLNRAWRDPSPETSPEVWHIRNAMEETGVDYCMDVHGDEALPYVFIAGAEGIPSLTEHQTNVRTQHDAALQRANPDSQTAHGYPGSARGKANLRMCTPWVAERFGCLAMTLEMPFKDNADAPDPTYGWSPARSAKLGEGCLDALYAVLDDLR